MQINPTLRHWLEGMVYTVVAYGVDKLVKYLQENPIPDADPAIMTVVVACLMAFSSWWRRKRSKKEPRG